MPWLLVCSSGQGDVVLQQKTGPDASTLLQAPLLCCPICHRLPPESDVGLEQLKTHG